MKNSVRNKKNLVYFAVSAVVIMVGAYAGYKYYVHSVNKNMMEDSHIPAVKVAKAAIMPVCRFLKLNGALTPNNSVELKAEVDSTIVKIHFSEGGIVEKGDLLIELDDSRAVAALREAEAQYAKIKSEYIPSDALAAKGVISKVKRDMLKADLDTASARIQSCKVNLVKHKVYAPFSGRVGLKEISEGQYVGNGTTLLKIVDNEQLRVDFKVPDINISEVYYGQTIDVTVDGNETVYNAVISAIDPASDKMSHSFSVRAIMQGKTDQMLKPGMFVKISLALDRCKKGIVVPESAVERYGETETVFRVTPEGNALRTPITSGHRSKGAVEILTGVNEGEIVVTEGHGRVLDGKPVKIVK